jgi:hypothetical protein
VAEWLGHRDEGIFDQEISKSAEKTVIGKPNPEQDSCSERNALSL